MGCDIHVSIEESPYRDGSWFTIINEFNIMRDYDLFAHFAGVRSYGGIKALSDPKGLPEDVSWGMKEMSKKAGTYVHSHSWLNFQELEHLPDKYKTMLFYKIMKWLAIKHGEQNVRMVFFFDN